MPNKDTENTGASGPEEKGGAKSSARSKKTTGSPGAESAGTRRGAADESGTGAGQTGTESTGTDWSQDTTGAESGGRRKNVEEKLDDFAERFSRAMSDGVKRMESAFDRGMENLKNNPNTAPRRVGGFFTSSIGGAVLIVIGFVWFFYAVGWLDNPLFPVLVIILGFYLMRRYKD